MNGIIVLDKPPDMTSAGVVKRVKRLLKAGKAGHTGTLDPFATGVLICCINKATRLARFLVYGKKRYEGTMRLGIRTDTQDLTGRVVSAQDDPGVTEEGVREAFDGLLEVKYQNPPAYSALKHRGEPLYKLARRGVEVRKPPRRVAVYESEVLDIGLPLVRFKVCCSAGTYVRTLCADIGEALGCGAHLVELHRTESGGFGIDEAISLDMLERLSAKGEMSNYIVPMGDALKGMPEVVAGDDLQRKIRHGRPATWEDLGGVSSEASQWLKVIDRQGGLLAVLESNGGNGVYPYACVFPEGS